MADSRTIRIVTEVEADQALKELQDLQAGLRKFKTEQSKAIEGSKEWQDATDNIEKVNLKRKEVAMPFLHISRHSISAQSPSMI